MSTSTQPDDPPIISLPSSTAVAAPVATAPQAIPIAPSTGFTSRYDSDYDDRSIALSDDDDDYDNNSNTDGYDDSLLLNSSSTTSWMNHSGFQPAESWISVADTVDAEDDDAAVAAAADDDDDKADVTLHDGSNNHNDDGIISNQTILTKAISIRPSSTLYLPSLPMDTMHRLSTFLTAGDLGSLSCTTKKMGERCQDVWKRVRGHVGRCLGEVCLAWVSYC